VVGHVVTSEVRIFDRDGTTQRGTVAGLGLTYSTAKGADADDISFSVSRHEDDYSPTLCDDALGIVWSDFGVLENMVAVATPYVLTPNGGVIVGEQLETVQVVGKGALSLTAEWPVLHHWHEQGVIARLAPQTRTFGWPTPSFDDSSWPTADAEDPDDTTFAKLGRPMGFGDGLAAWWVYRDASHGDSGALTLFRIGTFTVTDQRKYVIRSTADEEHKLYLNGHFIAEDTDQETGYTHFQEWPMVLAPGDYFLAAEMTTVDSVGGDGFDALRAFVATVGEDGEPDTVVLSTDATTKVWRQAKGDPRPGLTVGDLLLIGQAEAQGWLTPGIASADLLTPTFDAVNDSNGNPWPSGEERTWDVGAASWGTVIADLGGVVDVWVTPDFGWHAAPQRTEANSVQLVKGSAARAADESLISLTHEDTTPVRATRGIAQTNDGFAVYQDAAREAIVPARAAYVESSQAQSIGEGLRLAEQFVDENGTVQRTFPAEFRAVVGALPWVDFGWGWTIGGYDVAGEPLDVQVLSVAAQEGDPVKLTAQVRPAP
jgi:hypothetical protein